VWYAAGGMRRAPWSPVCFTNFPNASQSLFGKMVKIYAENTQLATWNSQFLPRSMVDCNYYNYLHYFNIFTQYFLINFHWPLVAWQQHWQFSTVFSPVSFRPLFPLQFVRQMVLHDCKSFSIKLDRCAGSNCGGEWGVEGLVLFERGMVCVLRCVWTNTWHA